MPLNPFLRAFFRSTIPAQCSPLTDYILLVPTTDVLLHSRDRESTQPFTDLVQSEEFLGSHVLRAPKDEITGTTVAAARENRGKARQYSTFNGRTVIIKDTWVYTNKGFRTLNQAQLQNDVLYWPNSIETQPWLIYYITRPLVGTLEHVPLTIKPKLENAPSESSSSMMPKRKEIKNFEDLLGTFPMIARQLQPGLKTLFQELEKSIPELVGNGGASSAGTSTPKASATTDGGTTPTTNSKSPSKPVGWDIQASVDEATMRTTIETAIMAAIELFQRVDQSQLQLLANTTDLTGSSIEHLIERYICEQLHDAYIFPRLLALKKDENDILDEKIKEMEFIDIAQVGISVPDHETRHNLASRIVRATEKFERMSDAKSPQEMLDILLETAQALTQSEEEARKLKEQIQSPITPARTPLLDTDTSEKVNDDETTNPVLTMNADMLVSLLLIVVIRAKVKGLQSSLTYMRNFVFIDEVEVGERGYVLSTLEGVLFHITMDSEHMGKAGKRNGRLWDRIRKGNVNGVRDLLERKEDISELDNGALSPVNDVPDVRFVGFDDEAGAEKRRKRAEEKRQEGLVRNGGLKVIESEINGVSLSPNMDASDTTLLPEIFAKIESPRDKLPELIPELEMPENEDDDGTEQRDLKVDEKEMDSGSSSSELPNGHPIPPEVVATVVETLQETTAQETSEAPQPIEILAGEVITEPVTMTDLQKHASEESGEVGANGNQMDGGDVEPHEIEGTLSPKENSLEDHNAQGDTTDGQVDGEDDEIELETELETELEIERETDTEAGTQTDSNSIVSTETGESTIVPSVDEDLEYQEHLNSKANGKAKFNPEVIFDGIAVRPHRKLTRSISVRSDLSRHSWASSSFHSLEHLSHSALSLSEDLMSVDVLSKTQNLRGESLVMMAVNTQQQDVLEYLIDESTYFSLSWLLQDRTHEGTTLLSAAIQGENYDIVRVIMEEVMKASDEDVLQYMKAVDSNGRTAGHYAFNQPTFLRHFGRLIQWTLKDKNGQTPLFALCRSYDHPSYKEMVILGIRAAEAAQTDGERLHLDDHVDRKGNNLLHIIHDQHILKMLLRRDSDVNAVNEKNLSPLMLASKYGRVDNVRTLFSDRRVDIYARESRGLTAVELAKDDDVRNKFDDMVMFSYPPQADGRITAVVRGIFVEDATVRLVLKSGMPSSDMKYTITTCRRLLSDFEFLAYWLSYEHPASWLPALHVSRSPFQLPSKPSRAVLRDIQTQLDSFLRILLSHSTFATHELLWEFFLMPDMQPDSMMERSKRKSEIRGEMVQEDFEPLQNTKDIEIFMAHARDTVRAIMVHTKIVFRRTNQMLQNSRDFGEAMTQARKQLNACEFMEGGQHVRGLWKAAIAMTPNDSNPYVHFLEDFRSINQSLQGMMTALERPRKIVAEINMLQREVEKHMVSLRRSDRWPLGLMDETRAKIHQGAADNIRSTKTRQEALSRELRYSQSVAAVELASFHEMHGKFARNAVRKLARNQVLVEKERLEGLKRALRVVRTSASALSPSSSASASPRERMGYTHYWRGPLHHVDQLLPDIRKLFAVTSCAIAGPYGKDEPIATDDTVAFNGAGEDSYESMVLTFGEDIPFGFCKTQYKPYDQVVGAVLLRCAFYNPGFDVSSDGAWEDWKAARELYQTAFGTDAQKPEGLAK
ncbi:hypothetical protein H072_9721 [Dactylellina haptotyla CBS 200.50]|uniref:VPS9 domain-containing protein n=1 Tax=Dactylellina haptotyla (strain CBS 200.50) TaxID=1284197 RepID=S8A6G1_DACHA|nr:hypothetical protein H072_9721 [Dactylellina haptotyla CBS 200.50]